MKLTSGESEFTIFCPKGGNGNGGLFLQVEASERVSLKETIVTAGFFWIHGNKPRQNQRAQQAEQENEGPYVEPKTG